MKLHPITIEEGGKSVTLHCRHKDDWPPSHALLEDDFESQRADGLIDDVKLQQLQVWKRVCGLRAMSAQKCPSCTLCLAEDKYGTLVPHKPSTAPKSPKPPFAQAQQNKIRR